MESSGPRVSLGAGHVGSLCLARAAFQTADVWQAFSMGHVASSSGRAGPSYQLMGGTLPKSKFLEKDQRWKQAFQRGGGPGHGGSCRTSGGCMLHPVCDGASVRVWRRETPSDLHLQGSLWLLGVESPRPARMTAVSGSIPLAGGTPPGGEVDDCFLEPL